MSTSVPTTSRLVRPLVKAVVFQDCLEAGGERTPKRLGATDWMEIHELRQAYPLSRECSQGDPLLTAFPRSVDGGEPYVTFQKLGASSEIDDPRSYIEDLEESER